jgi:selenide,water dikinase
MVGSMTQLNAVVAELRDIAGVHAMTDVTGFGFLGHLLEVCRGSKLGAEAELAALPAPRRRASV